jgi:hemoglobin
MFAWLMRRAVAVLALGAICALAAPSAPVAAADPNSLYARLGGYDAIAAVTDDFIGRLATDPKLTKFFVGLSDSSKARVRQLVVDQLCAASGGPCIYLGRDMKTAHAGLGITNSDWDAAVVDLGASLTKFNVGMREQRDLGAALTTLKADIVTK